MVELKDFLGLIHPFLAIAFIFPLLGMVSYFSLQTRRRRLGEEGKKIPANVGGEHLRFGRWLSNGVVLVALIGLAYPIYTKMAQNQVWAEDPLRAWFATLIFAATIASLFFLNKARTPLWRGIFATLTGAGLIILGSQPEVFRRGFEWYISHYYYGIAAALLMIFSLAIFPDIYKDRSNRWRNTHIILNCIALLLFIGQGFTGTRDLLEIPLSWQQPYIEQLYINNCQTQDCTVQPADTQNSEESPSS
jgi:hypothetical protein